MADNSNRTESSDQQSDALKRATDSLLGPNPFVGMSPEEMLKVAQTMMQESITNPINFLQHSQKYFSEMLSIMTNTSSIAPERGDRRFKDPVWNENPMYRAVLQSYLAARRELNEWVDGSSLDTKDKERAQFVLSLITESLSPSNSALNPTALKRMFETGGKSAQSGLQNMLDDFIEEGGMPSMVDKSAFSVGDNLATSQGNVVFRNEVLELIQYTPLTAQVYQRPMMIVPPQINKFYIFDLSPHNSILKYCLEQGQQMFAVSWRNPTSEHSDWGLDTYIDALIEATDAMIDITGSKTVNLFGACSGGITSTALLAYLVAQNDDRVNAMTLLVSVFDTSVETQLGLFSNDATLAAAKARSAAQGILPGKDIAKVFAWMRPNDLIWNYWVNNYLLGNKPPAFDVLYWNCDTTNLPARFHGELLDLFRNNSLVKPGALKINGVGIDLSRIKCDFYSLAGTTDHITPWDACYASTHLIGGDCTFVLSSSGHIQSIINPPGNPKAKYFTNDARPADAKSWQANATEQSGSWWEHWHQWLGERSGSKKAARKTLGSKNYPPMEKAPGTYVYG